MQDQCVVRDVNVSSVVLILSVAKLDVSAKQRPSIRPCVRGNRVALSLADIHHCASRISANTPNLKFPQNSKGVQSTEGRARRQKAASLIRQRQPSIGGLIGNCQRHGGRFVAILFESQGLLHIDAKARAVWH
jgi:hypothetical protein